MIKVLRYGGILSNVDMNIPNNISDQYVKFQSPRPNSLGGVRAWTDRQRKGLAY